MLDKSHPDYKYTLAAWAEAFTIMAKYTEELWNVQEDHEIIYAGPNPEVVSDEDKARLDELDWMICEEHECFSKFT